MSRAAALVFTAALLASAGCEREGPDNELARQFYLETRDGPAIDHGAWQRVLNDYLVPRYGALNRVDYAGLAADGTATLDAYLADMATVDPSAHSHAEQMAYWINVYNALTVRRIVTDWPVDTILDVGGGAVGRGPWGEPAITVDGTTLSLDDIEHRILRGVWREPRIHFAVNCASVSCPDLQPIAFTGANLEAQLALGARNYLASPRGVVSAGDALLVSSLFDWYAEDFGYDLPAVLERLAGFADADTAALLRAHEGPVRYAYDWAINGTK